MVSKEFLLNYTFNSFRNISYSFPPEHHISDLMKVAIYSSIFDRYVTYFETKEKVRNSKSAPVFRLISKEREDILLHVCLPVCPLNNSGVH